MITKLKEGNTYVVDNEGIYTEFVCDEPADVLNLPTGANSNSLDRPRPGSTAVITSTQEVYVLTNQREWVALVEG